MFVAGMERNMVQIDWRDEKYIIRRKWRDNQNEHSNKSWKIDSNVL